MSTPTNQSTKKTSESVKTPRALGCYVFLTKPRAQDNGDPAYSIALLFEKTADLSKVEAAIVEAAVGKWGPNAVAALKSGRLRNPLRDGDEKFTETGDQHFKGKRFLNAKSTSRPGLVDTNMQPVDPNEVYSGCFFHAAVRFYAYDKNGNKGVGAGLQNLMLVGKGTRIDGRKSADKDFEGFQADVREGDADIGDMI
jgi:hypothetical protein